MKRRKIITMSLIIGALFGGACYWYLYLYQAPVIFSYVRYEPPMPYYVEQETPEQIAAEPARHVALASYQVENMEDVRERYAQVEWAELELMGPPFPWDKTFRPFSIKRAKDAEVLVRFEYVSLKGDRFCIFIVRNKKMNLIAPTKVLWENDGWKNVITQSPFVWGYDVDRFDTAYALKTIPNGQKPLTEKGISDLVRKIRQEVLAKDKE